VVGVCCVCGGCVLVCVWCVYGECECDVCDECVLGLCVCGVECVVCVCCFCGVWVLCGVFLCV